MPEMRANSTTLGTPSKYGHHDCLSGAYFLSMTRKPMAGAVLGTCSSSCPQRWPRFMGTKTRLRSGHFAVESNPGAGHGIHAPV